MGESRKMLKWWICALALLAGCAAHVGVDGAGFAALDVGEAGAAGEAGAGSYTEEMGTKFQMQARSSADGLLYSWRAASPDRTGLLFPGPGSAQDIAIYTQPVALPPPPTPAVHGAGAANLAPITAVGTGSIASYPLAGFNAATAAWFADAKTIALSGTNPNKFFNTSPDGFARVRMLIPGTDLNLSLEAVSLGSPANAIGVWAGPTAASLTLVAVPVFTTTSVKQTQVVTLPAGTRVVDLVNGAFLTGISLTAFAIVPVAASIPKRAVGYGDSILAGNLADATFGVFKCFGMGLRYSGKFDGYINRGVAGSSLAGDTNSGGTAYYTTFTGLVNQIIARTADGTGTRVMYDEIGTNDYKVVQTSAAAFGAGLGAFYDALHTADPSIKIVRQTLFHRFDESANTAGSTWVDYNNAITAVAASRSYVSLIDGSQAWTVTQIHTQGDGLHPLIALQAGATTWLLNNFTALGY